MKIKDARISISINKKRITIKLDDHNASTRFAEIEMTPEQFAQALSGLYYTKCNIEIHHLNRIGKTMLHKEFKFKLPKGLNYFDQDIQAEKIVKKICPKGWKPDLYFRSQNSFFEKNNKTWARTTIRKWIKRKSKKKEKL